MGQKSNNREIWTFLSISIMLSILVFPMVNAQIDGILLHCDKPTEFNVGEQGKITVTIENLLNVKKGFNLRVKECYGNFGAGDSQGFTINSGEKITKSLSVTAGDSDNGRCLIELKESFTNEVDTCYVEIKSLPIEENTYQATNDYQINNYDKKENYWWNNNNWINSFCNNSK